MKGNRLIPGKRFTGKRWFGMKREYLDCSSSLCKAGDELLEHVGHLDERTDRDELVDAVVAIAAGGKVGAGQTAERQLSAVGAASMFIVFILGVAG